VAAYSPSSGLPSRRAEHSVDPDGAPVHPDGYQVSSFPEVEEPDLHPADARPPALVAWDASDDVRQDAMADAADLRPEPADAVGKLVAQEPDVLEPHASRHQSELPAVPAAEPGALVLCTPVADPFAEQSSAALVVAERLALPQQEKLAERLPKSSKALAQKGAL